MHLVQNTSAGFFDQQGKLSGFHLDFLNALESHSGICLKKKLLPYFRANRAIILGEHDGGILARSPSLDPYVEYIAKLITSRTIIVPRKGLTLKHQQDLAKITIGKIRGASLGRQLDNDRKLSIIEISNYKQGMKLLKMGRIDALAGNELGLSVIERNNIVNDMNLSGNLVVGKREVWLLLSNQSKHQDKLAQLKWSAQKLISEGVLDNILAKYFGADWEINKNKDE